MMMIVEDLTIIICCKRGTLANVCREDCVGETCSDDDDCGGPKESCNSNTTKCAKSGSGVAGWVIAVVVVSVVVVVGVYALYRYTSICRGSSRREVVVIQQRHAQRTVAIIALREIGIVHTAHSR